MQIEKSSPTVFTPLADRSAVLLNLETLCYYSLNSTGAVVWQLIENSEGDTLEDLVTTLVARFEVDRNEARETLIGFLWDLQNCGLVHLVTE